MSKVFTRKKIRELALLMFDSGHLTLPEHESLLTEWFEQNAIGGEELLDAYQGLYDDYQSLIVGKMRIDKELKAHQYWANWLAQNPIEPVVVGRSTHPFARNPSQIDAITKATGE